MTSRSIDEDDRSSPLPDEIRDPFQLIDIPEVERHLAENDQIERFEVTRFTRKLIRLFTALKTRFALLVPRNHRRHFPLLITVEEIAQIARLPTRSAVDNENLP